MQTTRSLKVLGRLFSALLIGLVASPMVSGATTGYYTQSGKIYDPASQEIQLRGISHFGFNADILQPQYLWQMGWKEQIAQIKSLGFNAVRVPFVPDTLYITTPVDQLSYVDPNKNPDLLGKTPLQVLDLWMAEADRQGLYILLDFHSVAKQRQYPTWFVDNPADFGMMYNGQAYSEDNWLRDLKFVAQRYASVPHFFAIDIYNEPNGKVRWDAGDANMTEAKYYWKPAVEKAAAAILQTNPNLLIFVQGVGANYDGVENSSIPMNWGEDFQPQSYRPLAVPLDKLVLTPHTYGPDVYVKSSFGAPNYPANLAADWETLFGQFASAHPVVVGEWGGRFGQGGVGQADVAWQNAFVDYLLSKNIRSSFYWCYTPNSGDTGGILDDNLNVRQDKMALLQRHWGGASSVSTLALSASTYTVAQNAGSVTIQVKRAGDSGAAVNVKYATANGTASAGSDYTAKSGTVSWASGDTATKSFSVVISNATPFTGSKGFSIALSNASTGAALGTPGTATVTINGSKLPAGTLALSSATYTVAQGTSWATIKFNRTGGSSGAVSVKYATANGTAKSGSDYTAKSGTVSWAKGDTATKSIGVAISKAVPFTGSRSFSITLSNASTTATLGTPSTATVTINGSKPAPAYTQPSISSFSPTSGAVGTVVTVTGRGFTGANSAWVGNGHNAALTIVSDTQVNVTVPSDATTGAIGIFNPLYSAFSSSSFTVTTSVPSYSAPYIVSFSPASGPVGTVVTLTGSAFTGTNAAWVGDAHDAVVSDVSDTQVKVTVPAGATTGAIAIFNPAGVSFTPSAFTVTGTPPANSQQVISAIAPTSGAVGTVITLTGSGFTGSNAAWVGSAHDAALNVISDTQAQVTVPAAGQSGKVAILNAQYSAFSTESFTVTTTTPSYAQPSISSFSPTSGPVGTVVTVAGSGFTGANAAWIGNGHDAPFTVINDTQASVTVPASATSGVITLLNPAYSGASTGVFTVSTSPPPPPPSGTLSVRVQGNRFINASGAVVQMRGVNYSGFEFAPIQGWSGSDPSGGQAGQPGGPKWSALQSWKVNTLRIPLNEASWLGYSCTDTSGVVRNPDPAGNYKSSVQTQVTQANAAGIYVILDLHWSAPGNACPMLQTQMANADHSLAFWTSVANTFKNNPAVVFELFNEPFMNFGFSGNTWEYMMKGTGGSFSSYPATSGSGNWQNVQQPWAIASYQAMINAVRATGATNVVLVGGMQYAQDLSGWLSYKPTDPLNQMGAAWHPYRLYQSAWDYPYPNFYPQVMTDAQNILAAGIPLVMTEVGGQNTPGTPSSPIVTTMTNFADTHGIGVLGWTWDVWGDPENVLIKDVNGTPTDGYGQVFRNWLLAH